MAKAKPTFNPGGYVDWGVRRTLREAENVARWAPWCAIEWMNEARNMISIDNPLFDEYNLLANRINSLWKSYEKYHWYDAREFWTKDKVKCPPQKIPLFEEESVSYKDISSIFKI